MQLHNLPEPRQEHEHCPLPLTPNPPLSIPIVPAPLWRRVETARVCEERANVS